MLSPHLHNTGTPANRQVPPHASVRAFAVTTPSSPRQRFESPVAPLRTSGSSNPRNCSVGCCGPQRIAILAAIGTPSERSDTCTVFGCGLPNSVPGYVLFFDRVSFVKTYRGTLKY